MALNIFLICFFVLFLIMVWRFARDIAEIRVAIIMLMGAFSAHLEGTNHGDDEEKE
jgi:hypothetical protein